MPLGAWRPRAPLALPLLLLAACSALLLLAACSAPFLSDGHRRTGAVGSGGPSATAVSTGDAQLVAGYLSTLDALARATPAEQAEIAEAARRDATLDPTTAHRLRWAFIQAAPGHGRSNPQAARTLLGEVLANPERLLPVELALAGMMYRDVNARLAIASEADGLHQSATALQGDRDRATATARRLQADNDRLKKELEETRAKLTAIAELEQNIAGRPK